MSSRTTIYSAIAITAILMMNVHSVAAEDIPRKEDAQAMLYIFGLYPPEYTNTRIEMVLGSHCMLNGAGGGRCIKLSDEHRCHVTYQYMLSGLLHSGIEANWEDVIIDDNQTGFPEVIARKLGIPEQELMRKVVTRNLNKLETFTPLVSFRYTFKAFCNTTSEVCSNIMVLDFKDREKVERAIRAVKLFMNNNKCGQKTPF